MSRSGDEHAPLVDLGHERRGCPAQARNLSPDRAARLDLRRALGRGRRHHDFLASITTGAGLRMVIADGGMATENHRRSDSEPPEPKARIARTAPISALSEPEKCRRGWRCTAPAPDEAATSTIGRFARHPSRGVARRHRHDCRDDHQREDADAGRHGGAGSVETHPLDPGAARIVRRCGRGGGLRHSAGAKAVGGASCLLRADDDAQHRNS